MSKIYERTETNGTEELPFLTRVTAAGLYGKVTRSRTGRWDGKPTIIYTVEYLEGEGGEGYHPAWEVSTVTTVSRQAGMAEINAAQMGETKKTVRTMSSISRTGYAIDYKDGRRVRLVLVDTPAEDTEDTAGDHAPWTSASHRTLLHKFTEATQNGRAVCNKSYRPWQYGNGYDFRTKAEHQASPYAHLFTFCPRCDAK
ncbi:hypothetical protein ACFY9C_34995 [Streptomyces filamentosus]|uniref:hypothetical protein n=1 Tax=Streptomyces filamentosus TaxID=67294 RepID=UPI0036E6F8C2